MPITRSYSAGRFLLLIDAAAAGYLQAVEGGEPYATVIKEEAGPDDIVPKHLGPVAYDPIRMSFGIGMTAAFYEWIGQFLNRKRVVKSGSIAFLDHNFNAVSRLDFEGALITEVTFPALDASDKNTVSMTLTIQPEIARRTAGAVAGAALPTPGKGQKQKALHAHSFRVGIDKLTTTGVSAVSALTISQPVPPAGREDAAANPLDVGNLTLTVTESTVKDFEDWFEDSAIRANPQAERSGTIELLSPSATPLLTLMLSNVGIVRIRRERLVSGAGVIARAGVELYAESIAFTEETAPTASIAVDRSSTSKADAATERSTALRAADGELVARRLIGTIQPDGGSSAPRRDEGAAIGERWAAESASLAELEQIAALEKTEWTALTLDDNHSLLAQLAGVPADAATEPGPRDLARDAFVEGLVTGAARVLRAATPHLGRRPPADG